MQGSKFYIFPHLRTLLNKMSFKMIYYQRIEFIDLCLSNTHTHTHVNRKGKMKTKLEWNRIWCENGTESIFFPFIVEMFGGYVSICFLCTLTLPLFMVRFQCVWFDSLFFSFSCSFISFLSPKNDLLIK